MYLYNFIEKKVVKLVDFYIKEKSIPVNSNIRMDMIVYTLNRVPPQYVTSARGVLHSLLKQDLSQTNADILSVISEGYHIITKRRNEDNIPRTIPEILEEGDYLFYPSVIGNVYRGDKFNKVEDALVYVYENNKLLEGYGTNFPNPATISKFVPGKFMFCFMPKKIERKEDYENKEVKLDFVVEFNGREVYKSVYSFTPSLQYCRVSDVPFFNTTEIDDIFITL